MKLTKTLLLAAATGLYLTAGSLAAELTVYTAVEAEDLMEKPFKEAVEAFKLRLLKKALAATRYNQKLAAARLGLTYHQFRGLYRQFKKDLT